MIRFCRSGTATAPISTPRSPRATITASASRGSSSSTATASAFSIFAITCAGEPAASISVLQRRHIGRRAHERERDEVEAELERELEIVDVLPRQRRDRQRDAGQVDALVRDDRAADEHLAARAAPLDVARRGAGRPVVDEDVVPGLSTSPSTAGEIGKVAVSGAVLAGRSSRRSPRTSSTGSREVADAELRPLEVGDQRDRPADLLLRLRGSRCARSA